MRISDWSSYVCSSDLCSSGHFNAAWHHPPMSAIHEPLPSLHRVPRASSAWIWVLLAAHLAVVLAWWQLGWRVGLRSEEHTSELQSLMRISYAVFCLKKKNTHQHQITVNN